MAAALLLVDLQRDYFPGGRYPLAGADEAVAHAARLLGAARRTGLPTIHIRHLSTRPDAAFFLPRTEGALFSPAVAPAPGETLVEKHFPNAFRGTGLAAVLEAHGVDRLVVACMMTHMLHRRDGPGRGRPRVRGRARGRRPGRIPRGARRPVRGGRIGPGSDGAAR